MRKIKAIVSKITTAIALIFSGMDLAAAAGRPDRAIAVERHAVAAGVAFASRPGKGEELAALLLGHLDLVGAGLRRQLLIGDQRAATKRDAKDRCPKQR